MSYMIEIAESLAETLKKFVTLNRHQLAGQVANLDFWADEALHCLSVIDDYHRRFKAMKTAQGKHAAEHHPVEFVLHDPCCLGEPARPPKRVPDAERNGARRNLSDAFYGFIVRCHNAGLIDKTRLERVAARIGVGIDAGDLKR